MSFSFSLDFQFSNRAENLCSQNKTDKTQTAIPQDCLLDARLRLVFPFHRVFTKSTEFPVLFFYSLDFQFSNRAENLCSQNKTDKTQTAIPCECLLGELRLSAGFPRSLRSLGMTMVGHPHPNGYIFEAFLYTQCATSKTEHEPQGDENMSAELDEKYENAWHSVA